MRARRLTASGITAICIFLGCGPPALRVAGTSCSTDGDCGAGLQCLPLAGAGGGGDAGCTVFATVCSKTCMTDMDCAAVGTNFTCFSMCSGAMSTCAQSQ
jgi:hypothetical protein